MRGLNNKIVVGVLILLALISGTAGARQEEHKQPTIDDIVTKMKSQLELTDQQAQAVKPIIEEYAAKEKQLKLEEKEQLRKVLTSDQLYAWNFLQNEKPHEKDKKKK